MTSMTNSLQTLLEPITPRQFLADYRGKRHVYIPGPPDKFAHISSWEEINRLLNMSDLWSSELIALAHDGPIIPPDRYCTDDWDRDGFRIKRPDPSLVMECIREGATLVLNLTESLTPPLTAVATSLQMTYGCPVKCNIYCSWQKQQGFRSHFDHTDVFVLHIAGRKMWNIYEGSFEQPMSGTEFAFARFSEEFHDKAKGQLTEKVEMTPGDLLYIPRGQYHDALAESEASLHLTFGIVHATALDMLTLLQSFLQADSAFRAPLPHFDNVALHEAHLDRLVDHICEVLGRAETAEYLREHLRGATFADCLPSYGLPDRDSVALFRTLNDAAGVCDTLQGDEADVAAWILQRESFVADSLSNSFEHISMDRLTAIVQTLIEKRLIEPRP